MESFSSIMLFEEMKRMPVLRYCNIIWKGSNHISKTFIIVLPLQDILPRHICSTTCSFQAHNTAKRSLFLQATTPQHVKLVYFIQRLYWCFPSTLHFLHFNSFIHGHFLFIYLSTSVQDYLYTCFKPSQPTFLAIGLPLIQSVLMISFLVTPDIHPSLHFLTTQDVPPSSCRLFLA